MSVLQELMFQPQAARFTWRRDVHAAREWNGSRAGWRFRWLDNQRPAFEPFVRKAAYTREAQGRPMLQPGGQAGEKRGGGVRSLALDEARLLTRIAARDLRAFEQLYRIYHPRLSRFLTNILRRPQLVEEALNDTLMVV